MDPALENKGFIIWIYCEQWRAGNGHDSSISTARVANHGAGLFHLGRARFQP